MAHQINWDLLHAVHPDSTVAGTRAGASLQDLKELYTGLKQLGLQYAYTPDFPSHQERGGPDSDPSYWIYG